MRPVNLLPVSDRRQAVNARRLEKSSFVVLGVLGVLLLGTLYYVTTANKITSGRSDIAKANHRTAEAKARAQKLGPFAEFAKVKATREKSVESLAKQRFDWERLWRETALVLPAGTSIQNLDASTTGDDASTGAAGGSSTTSPAPATGTPAADALAGTPISPSMHLLGCATSQDTVATMLVRLRALHNVDDVTLADSEKADNPDGTGAPAAAGAATSDSGSDDSACPTKAFKFDVTVTFQAPTPGTGSGPDLKRVPSRLGGGA